MTSGTAPSAAAPTSPPGQPGPLYERLGAAIRQARSEAGLTAFELAEQLERSLSTVRSWEHGTRRVDVEALVHLADALGTSVASLLSSAGVESQWSSAREAITSDPEIDPRKRVILLQVLDLQV